MSRRRSNRPSRSDRPERDDREREPVLFDLPLDPPEPAHRRPEAPAAEAAAPPEPPDAPAPLSLFDDEADPEEPMETHRPAPGPRPVPDRPEPAVALDLPAPPRVTLASRFLAGLADLAVHGVVAVLLLLGTRLLGVAAGYDDWPAVVVFLLAFSFLYSILPLAFWGQTPGMAWAGLVARAPGDVSLTFGQTARRWLGWLLTVVLLGLPALIAAAGGRSLADLLSGSELQAI